MGLCASYQQEREDAKLAKIAEFVKTAYVGDVMKLSLMLQREEVDVDAQDRFGMTALHWAAYGGQIVCVQDLIKANASLQIVDNNGRNALHHACRKDRDDVVRYLVGTAKMDVNAQSESKDTPLHKAVMGKSVKCIELLLQLGADPSLRNDQNRTPLEELDADPGTVRDEMPEPIAPASPEHHTSWRHSLMTVSSHAINRLNSSSSMRHRGSTGASSDRTASAPAATLKEAPRRSSVPSRVDIALAAASAMPSSSDLPMQVLSLPDKDPDAELRTSTLITSFRRLSEGSEHGSSVSSRGSSDRNNAIATASATANNSTAPSSPSTSPAPSPPREMHVMASLKNMTNAQICPLNLQGLSGSSDSSTGAGAAPALSASSRSCSSALSSSILDTGAPMGDADSTSSATTSNMQHEHKQGRVNLKMAGHRVIMGLRVAKFLTGDDKRQLIRNLLTKTTKKYSIASATPSNLVHQESGFLISMPPTI